MTDWIVAAVGVATVCVALLRWLVASRAAQRGQARVAQLRELRRDSELWAVRDHVRPALHRAEAEWAATLTRSRGAELVMIMWVLIPTVCLVMARGTGVGLLDVAIRAAAVLSAAAFCWVVPLVSMSSAWGRVATRVWLMHGLPARIDRPRAVRIVQGLESVLLLGFTCASGLVGLALNSSLATRGLREHVAAAAIVLLTALVFCAFMVRLVRMEVFENCAARLEAQVKGEPVPVTQGPLVRLWRWASQRGVRGRGRRRGKQSQPEPRSRESVSGPRARAVRESRSAAPLVTLRPRPVAVRARRLHGPGVRRELRRRARGAGARLVGR